MRAIAIGEIIREESKRKFEVLNIFSKAERIRKTDQLNRLLSAEERMKITIKNLDDLIFIAKNTVRSEENQILAIDVYNEVLSVQKESLEKIEKNRLFSFLWL